jgi:hypothetical protein
MYHVSEQRPSYGLTLGSAAARLLCMQALWVQNLTRFRALGVVWLQSSLTLFALQPVCCLSTKILSLRLSSSPFRSAASMQPFSFQLLAWIAAISNSLACDDCNVANSHIEHVRHVRRVQPGAINPTYGPTRALEWGQANFLHTVNVYRFEYWWFAIGD